MLRYGLIGLSEKMRMKMKKSLFLKRIALRALKNFVILILDFELLSLAGLTEFLSFEKYFVKSIYKGKELISRNFRKSFCNSS